MANTAAHLVDRVLPDVPVRQYVLSLPYELRPLAACKADVLTAARRLFETYRPFEAREALAQAAQSARRSSRSACRRGSLLVVLQRAKQQVDLCAPTLGPRRLAWRLASEL